MDFGTALRESRRSRGLTQAEVGKECGLSRQAVSLLEAGGGRVSTLRSVRTMTPIRIIGLPHGPSYGARIKLARGLRSIAHVAALSGQSINTIRAIEADNGTVSSLARTIAAVAPNALAEAVHEKKKPFWRTVHGKSNPDRDLADYYATPAPIVRMLLDYEHFELDSAVLEPCLGEARVIEHVLLDRGFSRLTCFDLLATGVEQRNFFDVDERYDVIITNPPFNQHAEFIKHAKKIAIHKVAMLLPLNYLVGAKRHAEIWQDSEFAIARVLIFNRGVNFLNDDPFALRIKSSQLYCAWYIFERGYQGPPTMRWINNHVLIERQSD